MKRSLQFYFLYTDGRPLARHNCAIHYNDQIISLIFDEQGLSNPLFFCDNEEDMLVIDHLEMIDLKTGFPTHKQIIFLKEFSQSCITIRVLPPPIIINLDHTFLLTNDELQYFKHNGNNALLYVHGFNLPLGNFGFYYDSYSVNQEYAIIEPHLKSENLHNSQIKINFNNSNYTRTIIYDFSKPEEICAKFPELILCYEHQFSHLQPEWDPEGLHLHKLALNGTHACSWFMHMEYNLNHAAGFNGKHFDNYTRLLGIHWPSGSCTTDYKNAERESDLYALPFAQVIEQLYEHGIKIHIIAHSLGCRLTLKMMKILAEKGFINCIEHIIFWQAALPNTALSAHSHFENAHQSARYITNLYSQADTILQTLFSAAQVNQYLFPTALGFSGAARDEVIDSLLGLGKLIQVDQSEHLLGHSFMKVPNAKLMQKIYQEYIIGGAYGIKQFGRYTLQATKQCTL